MLIDIDTGRRITHIPHEDAFRVWRSRLTDAEYDAIVAELTRRIDSDSVHTAGWIPGSDWSGTVFQPIYEKACNRDAQQAGLCFGLIVWIVLHNHPERWGFGRYAKDGVPIPSMTYFKLAP